MLLVTVTTNRFSFLHGLKAACVVPMVQSVLSGLYRAKQPDVWGTQVNTLPHHCLHYERSVRWSNFGFNSNLVSHQYYLTLTHCGCLFPLFTATRRVKHDLTRLGLRAVLSLALIRLERPPPTPSTTKLDQLINPLTRKSGQKSSFIFNWNGRKTHFYVRWTDNTVVSSRGLLDKGGNDKNATFSVSPSPIPLYCDIWDCPRCWLALCVFYIINGCNALVITLWNHCEIKHWLLHPPSPSQTNDQHNPI